MRSRICVMPVQQQLPGRSKSAQKEQDKPRDELARAGNWRFRTMPQICFIWFADGGKKKEAAMILIVTPSVARWGNSIGCKVGLTSMLRNCVSFFMLCTYSRMLYLFIYSPQTAPIPHIPRLAQPCATLASSVHAPVYFRQFAWSLSHGLLSVFTLVCSSHLHG